MSLPTHRSLPVAADAIAADGCEVRRLGRTDGASMAQFQMPAGTVGRAVVHQQVEEIWYIVSGGGEMWVSTEPCADQHSPSKPMEEIIALSGGVSLTIPANCRFQLRAGPHEPLVAVAVTTPPWPGGDEVMEVRGLWTPTVEKD